MTIKKIIFVLILSFLLFSCIDDFRMKYFLANENATIYVLNYTTQDVSIVVKDTINNTIIEKVIGPQLIDNYQENYAKLKEDFGEGSVYFTRHGQYLPQSENSFVVEDSNLILSSTNVNNFEGLTIFIQNQEELSSSTLFTNKGEICVSFNKVPHTSVVNEWLQEGKLLFSNKIGSLLIADYEDIGSIHLKNPQYIIVIAPELSEGTK